MHAASDWPAAKKLGDTGMLALQKFGQNLSFNWHRHRPSESSPSFEVPAIQPSIERAQTFRHPPIIDRDNRQAWPNSAIRVAAFFDQMPNVSNLKLDNKYKVVLSTKLFVGIFALVIEVIGSAIFLASPYWRVSGFPLCFYQSNHLDHHLSTVTFNKSQRCWLYQVA